MARDSERRASRRRTLDKELPGKKPSRLQVNIALTGEGKAPPLAAYLFSPSGEAIAAGPVENGRASLPVPAELDGRRLSLFVSPRPEGEGAAPAAASLRRLGAVERTIRYLVDKPTLDLRIPIDIIPPLCVCHVRGRLVKRVTLPDGTVREQAVCNARVHICEVDRIPIIIGRLPDRDIFRLRDNLLEILRRPVPPPPLPEPFPPVPGPFPPGPVPPGPFPPGPEMEPFVVGMRSAAQPVMRMAAAPARTALEVARPTAERAMLTLSAATSAAQLRRQLVDIADLVRIYICELRWLWWWFKVDCLWTVEVDAHGRFDTWIFYRCGDQPDLYFWVEQQQGGAWVTVYKPSVACHTYWNYDCSHEVTINVPGAIGCDDPPYDLPPGVTLFVLPYAIGGTPIWGKPPGSPPAPVGWVRTDGQTNYVAAGLGQLNGAPFGGTLHFIHDDSYFIPSSGIKYYRYSYRRAGSSGDWTPVATPLARGYRMEYSDRLPTYESYPVGPFTVGAESNLFEFKPIAPPSRPTDPATVVAREWTSGNLSEAAAVWNTLAAAPPATDPDPDQAGQFEVRIEVFSPTGVRVAPGPTTFRFLALNTDKVTTRLATTGASASDPMEVFDDAFHFFVHVDNNGVTADIPQPSVDGVGADPNCGFLFYDPADPADDVLVRFHADHPNDRAVFRFTVVRGSNVLPNASTPPSGSTPSYVEVASALAPLVPGPGYALSAGYYQRTFEPVELVGPCVNAAFAASLSVYGKATNGWWRLGYDTYRLIAFALAAKASGSSEPGGPGG
jgi:hypothetical protein